MGRVGGIALSGNVLLSLIQVRLAGGKAGKPERNLEELRVISSGRNRTRREHTLKIDFMRRKEERTRPRDTRERVSSRVCINVRLLTCLAADMITSHLNPYHNMLQIPSSVLSLFSFSSKGLAGLFGGFCIGAQLTVSIVLSGLSVPKITDSLNLATRTTEIVLLPTKCALSNGTISFPYVAAMGYATIIFASFFYILRAKGFGCSLSTFPPIQNPPHGHPPNPDEPTPLSLITPPRTFSLSQSHNVVNTQPSSPPPEPSSLCTTGKAPRRNRWIWLLLLLLSIVVMLLVGTYVYFYFTCPDSPATLDAFTSFWVQAVLATEIFLRKGYIAAAGCISTVNSYISTIGTFVSSYGWQHSKLLLISLTSTISTYISSYGWQYSKLLLISITNHFVCVRIVKALKHRVYAVRLTWLGFLDNWADFATMVAIISSSKLSWILWIPCYYYSLPGNSRPIIGDSQPIVVTVHKSLLWLWRHVQFSFPLTPSLEEISVSV